MLAPGGASRDACQVAHPHQQARNPPCPVSDCPVLAELAPRRRTERGWGPIPQPARRCPTRPGNRHARAFPFMVLVPAPLGAKTLGPERAEACLRAEFPSRSSTPRALVGGGRRYSPAQTDPQLAGIRTNPSRVEGAKPRAPWNPNEPKPNSNSNAPELHQNPNEPEPVARDTNWGSLKSERTQGGSEPWTDAPLTSAGCRLGGFLCPEGTL